MNRFFKTVRNFILDYLPNQRCYSDNTIKSYRTALHLFVEFLRTEKAIPIHQIDFPTINRSVIVDFLNWLEISRGCNANSRNHRLTVLRSFFTYAGMMDCTQISLQLVTKEIPIKKSQGRIVEFLSEKALETLLDQPNLNKSIGLRDQFFMILMYDTGARCSELLNMTLKDLRFDSKHPTAYLIGKGNKPRCVPMLSKTVSHCKRYFQLFHPSPNENDYLFYTVIHGKSGQMSADCVARFMKKYGELARQSCPEVPDKVHPHQLRHTRAIHYYRDGMPLSLIAEYLGHANVETTKIYAYADTEMKRVAMEKADKLRNITPLATPIWQGNDEMILKLSGLK